MNGSLDDAAPAAQVFDRLGSIVRSLHEALREVGADNVLAEAASEFPSARERLLHIGRLTEKAANTVLTKVEKNGPIQASIASKSQQLKTEWDKLYLNSEAPDSMKTLIDQTRQFLDFVEEGSNVAVVDLSEMMMAQDFQDLTGQLITKVVTVLARTENELLRLLIDAAPPGANSAAKQEELMAGPGAPGSVAMEQMAVDDLLADLGF